MIECGTIVQNQNAVSVYFPSKQIGLMPFGSVVQSIIIIPLIRCVNIHTGPNNYNEEVWMKHLTETWSKITEGHVIFHDGDGERASTYNMT